MLRRRLLRNALAAALLATAGCRSPGSPDRVPGDPVPGRLEALFAALHARELFDGAVVVGRGRDVLWRGGFGWANREEGVRFTPETAADGASLAKTFTAAVVLALDDEGRLALERPVRDLLPELPYEAPTIRHLLSHSSGIVADYAFFDADLPPGVPRTTERLLEVVAKRRPPLAFEPGSRFEYNSFGYDLAALAAARAAGTTVAELFATRIFRPLGMASAFVRPARFADWKGVRTRAYRRIGTRVEPHEVFDDEAFAGGSNVYFSALDLHLWSASFLARPPLPAAALARGLAPARIGAGSSGLTLLSWYRDRDGRSFWYSGHLQGFHDELFRDLDTGLSIAYVSNHTLEPWLMHGIVRAVRAVAAGREPEPLAAPETIELGPARLAGIPGLWRLEDGERLRLEWADGGLHVRTAEGVDYRCFPIDERTLYAPGLDLQLGFAQDADGAITRIRVSSNLALRWGKPARGGRAR